MHTRSTSIEILAAFLNAKTLEDRKDFTSEGWFHCLLWAVSLVLWNVPEVTGEDPCRRRSCQMIRKSLCKDLEAWGKSRRALAFWAHLSQAKTQVLPSCPSFSSCSPCLWTTSSLDFSHFDTFPLRLWTSAHTSLLFMTCFYPLTFLLLQCVTQVAHLIPFLTFLFQGTVGCIFPARF